MKNVEEAKIIITYELQCNTIDRQTPKDQTQRAEDKEDKETPSKRRL